MTRIYISSTYEDLREHREKAARGTDGRIFPWGDEPDPDKANYDDTRIRTTSAVGCFPRGTSPFEIEEAAGNVWEWTRSLWGKEWSEPEFGYPYRADAARERLDAPRDVLRVLRGGSWVDAAFNARCAYRVRYSPDGRDASVGFRVVASPF